MRRSDLPAVVALECKAGGEDRWQAKHLLAACRGSRRTLVYVDAAGRVRGFVSYERRPGRTAILNLVVDPAYRRRGVARRLLSALPAGAVSATARESNLPYQLFLKALGFRCWRVTPAYFDCPPEPALRFYRPG